MQGYILAVCGAVILSALITILMPEGKIGKFINGILKLFCVAVMLLPLPSALQKIGAIGMPEGTEASLPLDTEFIEAMFESRAREQQNKIQTELEEEYEITVDIQVLWERNAYEYVVPQVKVKIVDFGINGEDRHIFVIEQVRKRVSEWFGNKTEVIVVE